MDAGMNVGLLPHLDDLPLRRPFLNLACCRPSATIAGEPSRAQPRAAVRLAPPEFLIAGNRLPTPRTARIHRTAGPRPCVTPLPSSTSPWPLLLMLVVSCRSRSSVLTALGQPRGLQQRWPPSREVVATLPRPSSSPCLCSMSRPTRRPAKTLFERVQLPLPKTHERLHDDRRVPLRVYHYSRRRCQANHYRRRVPLLPATNRVRLPTPWIRQDPCTTTSSSRRVQLLPLHHENDYFPFELEPLRNALLEDPVSLRSVRIRSATTGSSSSWTRSSSERDSSCRFR